MMDISKKVCLSLPSHHKTKWANTFSTMFFQMILCLALHLQVINLVTLPMEVSSQSITSTLHSTEYGVKFAYDRETVAFTCRAEGNSLGWSSDEYIGAGGSRLEFVSIDPTGTTYRVGQTVATLTNISNANGLTTLESLLQVSVQSAFQISSIRCHSLGSDTVNTILFETAGNTSITCNKRAACPEETVKCTCITGYSNTLAWTSDQLIGPNNARLEFVSIDPILTTHRVPGSSTFAVLTDVSSPNDVVVLSSDLTFTASDSPAHTLTCLNVGRQSSYSIIIPKSKSCVITTAPSIPDTTSDWSMYTSDFIDVPSPGNVASGNSDVVVGVSVFLSTVIIALMCAIIILMAVLVHVRNRYTAYKKVHIIVEGVGVQDSNNTASEYQVSGHGFDSKGAQPVELTELHQAQRVSSDSQATDLEDTRVIIKQECSNSWITTTIDSMSTSVVKSSGSELPHENNKQQTSESGTGATSLEHVGPSKAELPCEPNSPELQQSKPKSEDGAAAVLQGAQFTEGNCSRRPNENMIPPNVEMRALWNDMQSQKERLTNIKKTVDGMMGDIFDNTRNNLEDANNAGGSQQADKGAKED